MKIYVRHLHLSIQHWNLIRRNGARRACRQFACDAMEQFVQVGLLPERDARQKNAGERYKLDDQSESLIASDGRVEIHPERRGGGQVEDANCIAQISVTHDFLLKFFFPCNQM